MIEFTGEEAVTAIELREHQRRPVRPEIHMGREEIGDPFAVLGAEYRTGHVDQAAARADGGGGLGEDGVLGLDIGGLAVIPRVRAAPRPARCGPGVAPQRGRGAAERE